MKSPSAKQSLRAEARNPATPAGRLRELARVGCAREVAGNPNAPVDLLLKLAARQFEAFLANPVLPLLLLEDPGFFLKLSPASLRRLLRREQLPETLLASLLRHGDAEVRDCAALHVQQAKSAGDHGDAVRRGLAEVRADTAALPELFDLGLVPAWLSEPLAGTANAELRDFVVAVLERGPEAEIAALGKLYRRAGAALPRQGKPSRPDSALNAEEMRRLASGGPWVRGVAARHPKTPPESLARLARDPVLAVRVSALRHPFTPEEALWAGSAAVLPILRRAVARNPAATDAMLARLASDPDPTVRRAVAAHRYLEPKALTVLAGDADAAIRESVARHRLTAPDVLEKLSADAEARVRRAAAKNPMTPPGTFARLAADPEVSVRTMMAQRRDLPDDLLCQLACDASDHARHCARFNRSNSHDLIGELLHLPNDLEAVRRAVARGKRRLAKRVAPKPFARRYHFSFPTRRWKEPRNPQHSEQHSAAHDPATPPEELARLVAHGDHWILETVASNPGAPVALLRELYHHSRITWRLYWHLAQNPNTPADLLAKLAKQPNSTCRSFLCWNKAAPLELLVALARDAEASVRCSVAGLERTPVATLAAMCDDPDESVQKALLANSAVPWAAVERWLPRVERDLEWRQRLAQRTDLPPEWRVRLLRDAEVPVRLAFARNACQVPEDFEVLANDPELSVRHALAQFSVTWNAETLERMAQGDDPMRLAMVARAHHLPPALGERLATHPAEEVRAALASNHATSDAALLKLAGDSAPQVRQALRCHPRCPPEEVDAWLTAGFTEANEIYSVLNCPGMRERHHRKLLASGNEDWRRAVVSNERTPLAILEEFYSGEDLKSVDWLARKRRLPDRLYEAIITRDEEGSLRHYTALSYHTPRAVAERIALTGKPDNFWERRTRVALARQKDAHPEFLCQLLDYVLAAPKPRYYRSSRMRRHYDHPDADVLAVLAGRMEIPMARLEPLLVAENPLTRRALIARSDLPPEWRARMQTAALDCAVNGRTSWARLAALCHPETKPDALRAFARTGRWLERLAVARNPAAPVDALELLAADSNRVIRAEASARLKALQRSKS